jgi:glycosyltransferase involved in cell wall biosynthesis
MEMDKDERIPLVSVAMITYNHEPYIVQAIEGVLMQQTSFDYELIIGEDCSTDNTRAVCLKYQQQYPDKIKVLLPDTNQGMMPNFMQVLSACRGKYIALCEGDDYWTDSGKLEQQANFLEKNPDFSIAFHNVSVIYGDNRASHSSNPSWQKEISSIDDLACGNFIYTASCVYRNNLFQAFPSWYNTSPVGDYVLHLMNAQYGLIKYFPTVMGVYRVHDNGVWSKKSDHYTLISWIKVLNNLIGMFSDQVNQKLIDQQIYYIKHYAQVIPRKKWEIEDQQFFPKSLWQIADENNQLKAKTVSSESKATIIRAIKRIFVHFKNSGESSV